jgi:outer membrane protein OmpA-like peptidoglycan-associated protein
MSSSNLSLTQTGSFTAAISSVTFGATTRDPYFYSTSLTTPNDVTISGTLNTSGSAITATGAARLLLASGANVTGGATFTASGISTAGPANATVQPTVVLTGASTTLAGNLTAYDLRVASGGSLYLPAGRTITAPSSSVQVLVGGTLTGAGTIAGPLQNRGTVAPGDNAAGSIVGTLTAASYRQESTGTTAIQLSSGGNDAIVTTGTTATYVDGIVAITRLGGFTPASGAIVTVVSSPTASSNASVALSAATTDDLLSSHFGPPTVSAKNVVVSLGATVPGAPGLTLVAGPASISATVAAPTSDGGAAITNYRVSCSPDCGGNHDSATAGVVALTGLTPGTPYTVSVIAQNSSGDSTATTKIATPNVVVVPLATVTPSTTKLVITTAGTFKAVCRYNVALVKTCAVTAKSAKGVVLATGKAVTLLAGASAVTETLTLNAAGVTAAKAAGGVTVVLSATITPVTGGPVTATSSLVVVNKSIKVTLLGNVLFASNSAVLSPAGKAALIKVARQIQGAKSLECDGHTAKTGNTAGEMKLGLQRATVACAYIKAEIKVLKLKPILKYVVKSYGSTRPVSKTNPALNRRVEFIVSN